MSAGKELFEASIYNPHDSGWFFGSGNPEFWKYKEILVKKGGSVLDIGIGQGRSSLFFALNGMSVEGIDHREELVELVNDMAKEVEIPMIARLGDFRETNFGENKYDIVLLDFAFVHANSKEEALEVLDRAYDAVKEGGHIWIRACGKHDEIYDSQRWLAERGSLDVEVVNENIIKSLCACSGELKMDPVLFFGTTDLIQALGSKGTKFIETRTLSDKDSVHPNIMYGEDWPIIREYGESFGTLTILAQKPEK